MESAKEDEFEVDYLTTPTGTSFSQLLFGDDDEISENALGVGVVDHQSYNNLISHAPIFSNYKTPKMLCFGNYQNIEGGELLFPETNNATPQKSVITSSDSSSASSCNHSTTSFNSSVSYSNSLQKKRNGSGQQQQQQQSVTKASGVGGQRLPKKTKATENPISSTGHAKRKEKLGERIAALQELVSPFGKTDTASVLHEAMGYIRFLHDQVQVLCSPYLQRTPSSHPQPGDGDNYGAEEDDNKDLRSRGLCLIPMECTVHVASTNGADFWSPATNTVVGNHVSPSTTKKQ